MRTGLEVDVDGAGVGKFLRPQHDADLGVEVETVPGQQLRSDWHGIGVADGREAV
ncbi:hypothetical protein ACFQ9X_56615 [Catenulispora yoronensis]